jgi:ADP-heptose:LPS heptosyltransferase
MHLIEAYSLYSGLKIDHPIIKKEPVNGIPEKFILFNPHSKGEAKFYYRWAEIISIIKPELDSRNISIIQIDSSEEAYEGCKKIDNITFNQTAWIMNEAICLLGIDSFCMHLASCLNKPMLILFGAHHHFNCCKPYFGDPSIQHFFIADLKGNKPTFSYDKGGEYLNQFDPKDVAEAFIKKIIKKL